MAVFLVHFTAALAGTLAPALPTPATTDWATVGVECVFFAASDVNADGYEDIVTVGGDRRYYVSLSVHGWKAASWRPIRDEPAPEGLIALERSADALLAVTPANIQVLRGPQLKLDRTVAAPDGRTLRAVVSTEPPLVETDDAATWRLTDAGLEPAPRPEPPPAPAAIVTTPPPYQPDAPLLKRFRADLNGDGLPDDVGVYRASRYGDLLELRVACALHTASDDQDGDGLTDEEERALGTDLYNRDTNGDGLLDGWEVHGLPRGIALPDNVKLNPLRQDVIVAIALYEQVNRAAAEAELAKAAELYRKLPNKNPDGSTGVYLHFRFDPVVPVSEQMGGSWATVGNARFSPRERGLLHWMQLTPWGGGQSALLGDMGGCGTGFAVFAHEFGHQLGLSHEGDSAPAWCPLYPSLMSYAFSYQLGGDGNAIRFSDGYFRDTVLDERHLSEYLLFYERPLRVKGRWLGVLILLSEQGPRAGQPPWVIRGPGTAPSTVER